MSDEIYGQLKANTPYIFVPDEDITEPIVFGKGKTLKPINNYYATLNSANEIIPVGDADWKAIGVYHYKVWPDERTPNEYGFAANSGTGVDKYGNEIGTFVAGEFVRAGKNTKIRPTRFFLRYTGEDETLKSKSAVVLPDRIVLVFPDGTASVLDPDDPQDDPSGDIETPTSEIAPTATANVWSNDKTIYIATAPGTAYRIIDASGRPLRTSITATDRDEVRLGDKADGIVIVIVGGKSFKIRY
jgi:hypothetical protein